MYTKVKVSRSILIIYESLIISILFIKFKKNQPQFYNQLNALKKKKNIVERIVQGLWICMELNFYSWDKLTCFSFIFFFIYMMILFVLDIIN